MFTVTEAEAATIRAAFNQHGGLSAIIELRRLCPDDRRVASAASPGGHGFG